MSDEQRCLRRRGEEKIVALYLKPLRNQPVSPSELLPQVLSTYLSPAARRILELIATRGPIAPKTIARTTKVERTRCYCLVADLRERGLIRDGKDGYVLVAREVWAEIVAAAVV